jgi:hypothetical protein
MKAAFFAVWLCGALAANAQTGPRPHHGPPQEAINACNGQSAGAACSMTMPDGHTLAGSCKATPDNQLACRPKPPAEAIAACNGKTAGAACTFTSPRGDSIQSTCRQPPDESTLVCAPPHHNRPHGGPDGDTPPPPSQQ